MNRPHLQPAKSRITQLLCVAAVAMATCLAANVHAAGLAGPADLVGQPAPLFVGKLLDGSVIALENLRGRVVVLDFWATWCPHCRVALPKLQRTARRFEQNPVTVLGINLDKDLGPGELEAFLKQNAITFGQVPDAEGHVKKKYGVRGIPCTVVVDKQGMVRSVHIGDETDLEQKLQESVASLL